jgi:hypothetical protein
MTYNFPKQNFTAFHRIWIESFVTGGSPLVEPCL